MSSESRFVASLVESTFSRTSSTIGRWVTIISSVFFRPRVSESLESRNSKLNATLPTVGSISFPSRMKAKSYKREDSLSTTHLFFFSYAAIYAS